MSASSRSLRHRLIGASVLALGVLLIVIAFTGRVPLLGGESGAAVTARFAQANEIDTSTPVRIGGVDVGHVAALRAAPDNTTIVVMRITAAGVRLHADAAAQIRWRTVLGGSMYVDLIPGSPSAPPLRGEIPISRTGSQVDWDEFNSQLPAAARPQLQRMLTGLSAGLSAPRQEGETLSVLGPAAQTVGEGAQALRGQDIGDLPSLVRTTARTLTALSSGTGELERVVEGADATLAVTAAHNDQLAQALQLSPPALAATLRTSGILNRTLTALDPLVTKLEPDAKLLGPTSDVLRPLLRRTSSTLERAVPLLQVAPGALQALAYASTEGIPLIAAFTPVVTRLNAKLIPWLDRTDPDSRLKLYEALGPTASALSGSMSGFDVNGYSYNFNVELSTGSILLPCDLGLTGVPNLPACLSQEPAADLRGKP